jgi:hypothetical protein
LENILNRRTHPYIPSNWERPEFPDYFRNNVILSKSKLPIMFIRAKFPMRMFIIKPGKDDTKLAHYRTISLSQKLLKCMIFQRIQLMIEERTSVSPTGFRKHRNCNIETGDDTLYTHISKLVSSVNSSLFVNLIQRCMILFGDEVILKLILFPA